MKLDKPVFSIYHILILIALAAIVFSVVGNSIFHHYQHISVDGQVLDLNNLRVKDSTNVNAILDLIGVKNSIIIIVNVIGFVIAFTCLQLMSFLISAYRFLRKDFALAKLESEKYKKE